MAISQPGPQKVPDLWGLAILVYAFSVIYLPACASQIHKFKLPEKLGPTDFDYELIDAFVKTGQRGILTAFNADPHMRGTRLQLSYFLEMSQAFEADFLTGNYTGEPIDYWLICLLNYRQQEFQLNGQRASAHAISIPPGNRLRYSLRLHPPGKGGHDFLLLAISRRAGSNIPNAVEFPVLSHRANIFVESRSFPPIKQATVPQRASGLRTTRVTLEPSHHRYLIHISNPSAAALRSALILFANSRQISFGALGERHWILYFNLDSKIDAAFEIEPHLQNDAEVLYAIYVQNPFVLLEPKLEVMNQIQTRVEISNFITLNANSPRQNS